MGLVSLEGRPESEPALFQTHTGTAKKCEGLLPGLQDIRPVPPLNLDSPACRSLRNKFLFFKLPSLWYLVIAAQHD
jgi:hypothetical protein